MDMIQKGDCMKTIQQTNVTALIENYIRQLALKDISISNYVKNINELLIDFGHMRFDEQLIHALNKRNESLKSNNKTINRHYIGFLESYILSTPFQTAQGVTIDCPYCGGQATLQSSKRVYKKYDHGEIYICENHGHLCDAFVFCHKGDNLPLGTLANRTTQIARSEAHSKIDNLWRNYGFNRGDTYKMLGDLMGLQREDCHIALFNEEQCLHAIKCVDLIM